MSRTIKFRAYDPENGFIYMDHYSIVFHLQGRGSPPTMWSVVDKRKPSHSVVAGCGNGTLEQFTGLKDKNGKEIYEGDICRIDWKDSRYGVTTGAVTWNEAESSWNSGGGSCKEMHWSHEVIGNIHENPELLNEHS